MVHFGRIFAALHRGPHGAAALALACSSALVALLLVAGLVFEPLRVPALAISIASVQGALVLVAVLLSRLRAKLNDVHYAISLEGALQRLGYGVTDFFTDEAAANPSLQLLHLKILRFCRPRRVLELGSGQTTKILSCYARDGGSAAVLTLEQDPVWASRLGPQVSHDYRHVPLEPRAFTCAGIPLHLRTMWYAEVPDLRREKFDYVLVDGPDPGTRGTDHTAYARAGILEYMPALLSESFVVVFDDAERAGEAMTIDALRRMLDAGRVRHVEFAVHGIKTQVVFCSPDRSFLQSI